MLLAVLEKRCGFKLAAQDVFVNVAGGLKLDDPGADLAIAMSILSSFENFALPNTTAFVGEIGLSGEVRAVNKIEQRIQEAEKLGFQEVILSNANVKSKIKTKLKLSTANTIMDVAQYVFG